MPKLNPLHPPKRSHPWKRLADSAWRKKTVADAAKRAADISEFEKLDAAEKAEEQASKGQSHEDYHDDYAQLQEKAFEKDRTQ